MRGLPGLEGYPGEKGVQGIPGPLVFKKKKCNFVLFKFFLRDQKV